MRDLAIKTVGGGATDTDRGAAILDRFSKKFSAMLKLINDRLAEVPWLAGEEFTAADIMLVCCLTTMRCFNPYDLGDYEHILAYLSRVSARDAYRQARQKGDPELDIAALAGATSPKWTP